MSDCSSAVARDGNNKVNWSRSESRFYHWLQTCQGSRISRESYALCFCSRCPARITKMILKLRIFTIIYKKLTLSHFSYNNSLTTLCANVELELTINSELVSDTSWPAVHGQIRFLTIWRLKISKMFSIVLATLNCK
jgi:hypothetical protein